MNWNNCYSPVRFGQEDASLAQRTPYERDFDRLIFSSAFRRLQDKTQVFPLPGPVLVHNRLTHSLEVASVGRSLGKLAGEELLKQIDFAGIAPLTKDATEFYAQHLSSVIASACLAHDIGNPSFGHSGEAAISAYFEQAASTPINNMALIDHFSPAEWRDLSNFEGNANSFRILTHHYANRQPGGYRLTYSTLAAIAKYPCASLRTDKDVLHRKKYGFFQADEKAFLSVATQTNMIPDAIDDTFGWKRHPFVFLVEAADDICYRIIDWEDAHRIGIIDSVTATTCLLDLLKAAYGDGPETTSIVETLRELENDTREQLAYLRAKCINYLVVSCARIFAEQEQALIEGRLQEALIDLLPEASRTALENINQLTIKKIYDHASVVKIELAGYEVMKALLEEFIPATLATKPSHKQKKIRCLLPDQFAAITQSTAYLKSLAVVDFISGMTDLYAMEMYKNIKGISLPVHSG